MSQQPDNMFNQPQAGGGYFESKNALNHLILITKVHDVYHNPNNVFGGRPMPRDEAKVDLVDLDAPGQEHRERIIVTHPGIVNRLSTGATNILGRIGTVPTDKGNDAFVLEPFNAGTDDQRAAQWVQGWQAGQFHKPVQQGQQQGWNANPQSPPPAYAQQQPQSQPQATAAPQGYQSAPAQQSGPQDATQAAPGLPPGIDPAALAALLANPQLANLVSGGQVQQTQDQPPY